MADVQSEENELCVYSIFSVASYKGEMSKRIEAVILSLNTKTYLFKKEKSVIAGNPRMPLVLALQIAAVIGTKYRFVKDFENL